MTPQISQQAKHLHEEALVWDNHGCFPNPVVNPDHWFSQLSLYKKGGANVAVINIGDANYELSDLMLMAAQLRAFLKRNPDHYIPGHSIHDIDEARHSGKLAVFLDVEGAHSIGNNLDLVGLYYDIGVRWMLMTYNQQNLVAGGCHDDEDKGLSPFGFLLIEEMDRVGMVKCCSHTGYRSAMDVLSHSSKPVIFSHSNPLALRNHDRNIPDELIKACAATGGVVGINGVGIFLDDNRADAGAVVRAIDYVVQLTGPDHAGIGLDYVFDQAGLKVLLAKSAHLWPEGKGYEAEINFFSPENLPEVTEGLLKLGYPEAAIRGIIGENLYRVAKDVWK